MKATMLQTIGQKRMMFLFLVVLFVMNTSPLAAETQERLTLTEAVAIALDNNSSLEAVRNQVAGVRSKVAQAEAAYYPQISANLGLTNTMYASRSNVNAYSTSISLSQTLYDFGQTSAQVQFASENLAAAEFSLESNQEILAKNVKQSFYNVLKNQELIVVAEENLDFNNQLLDQAELLFGQGLRPNIDVTTAEVNVSQAKLSLFQSENALRESVIALENLLGRQFTSGNYQLIDDTRESGAIPSLDQLVEIALTNRPELATFKAQIKSAEANLDATEKSAYPTISGQLSFGFAGDAPALEDQNLSVGLSLSWSIFDGFRQSAQVTEKTAEINNQRALLANKESQIVEEVTLTYLQLRAAEETINNAEITLKQAEENMTIARERYNAGISDSIELSNAQVLYSQSKSTLVQANFDRLNTMASLEYAIGDAVSRNDI